MRTDIDDTDILALRERLAALPLPRWDERAQTADTARQDILRQIDGLLVPRLQEGFPTIAVLVGATGGGKSTVLNALCGTDVSPTGGLRPTTVNPVWVCAPSAATMVRDRLGVSTAMVRQNQSLPAGLVLVDGVDAEAQNTVNAGVDVLGAASIWVAVTSATRYADARLWDLLHQGRQQSAEVLLFVNKLPAADNTLLRDDLAARIGRHGLETLPVVFAPVVAGDADDDFQHSVRRLRKWLWARAAGAQPAATPQLEGVLDSLPRRLDLVLAAAGRSADSAEMFRQDLFQAASEAALAWPRWWWAAVEPRPAVNAFQTALSGLADPQEGTARRGTLLRMRAATGPRTAPALRELTGILPTVVATASDDFTDRLRETVRNYRTDSAAPSPLSDPATVDGTIAAVQSWLEELRDWVRGLGQSDVTTETAAREAPLDHMPAERAESAARQRPGLSVRLGLPRETVALALVLETIRPPEGGTRRNGAAGAPTSRRVIAEAFGPELADALCDGLRRSLAAVTQPRFAAQAGPAEALADQAPTTQEIAGVRRAGQSLQRYRGTAW